MTINLHIPVLEFRDARYRARIRGLEAILRLDLAVAPRQAVLIKLDRERSIELMADACCGLVQPVEGDARFLGRRWSEAGADEANALRGGIGRVFSRGGWVSYLSLAENVLIQQLHHTWRPSAELREEASNMAQQFGLPGLPVGRPDSLSTEDLQRAALVRAFLGQPKLVVLEGPVRENVDLLSPLATAIMRAQEQGAAVVWLASRMPPSHDLLSLCDQRLRIRQSGQMEALR